MTPCLFTERNDSRPTPSRAKLVCCKGFLTDQQSFKAPLSFDELPGLGLVLPLPFEVSLPGGLLSPQAYGPSLQAKRIASPG